MVTGPKRRFQVLLDAEGLLTHSSDRTPLPLPHIPPPTTQVPNVDACTDLSASGNAGFIVGIAT